MLDFNTYPSDHVPDCSTAEICQRLNDRIESLAFSLLGPSNEALSTSQELRYGRQGSLSIKLGSGRWFHHEEKTGGAGLELIRWHANVDEDEALELARQWLGVNIVQFPAKPKPPSAPQKAPPKFVGAYNYVDESGTVLFQAVRYREPKTFRQRRPDGHGGWIRNIDGVRRVPYRLPELLQAVAAGRRVYIAEGEKDCDALAALGLAATCNPEGAGKWRPEFAAFLRGADVAILPDNDEPGRKHAIDVANSLDGVAATWRVVQLPCLPEKGDAADWIAAGGTAEALRALCDAPLETKPARQSHLAAWTQRAYAGKAPEQEFLVSGAFPLGVVSIVAAMGDAGKGMLSLHLALSVATSSANAFSPSPAPQAFGGEVQAFGTAVIFAAEDDYAEVHRRLERLDPAGYRLRDPDKLIVVPMPNAGIKPIIANGKSGPEATPFFGEICEDLATIPDLRLVVFDPLASFVHCDVNADPAAGAFVTGQLAGLASRTGPAVLVSHHMRKPAGGRPITTVEQARDAIRGTSAIVDGVRCVYALWPATPDLRKATCDTLKEEEAPNKVFCGAVVKANGPADRTIRTYVRSNIGLLEDVTQRLRETKMTQQQMNDLLVDAIAGAAERGHPFTHTGPGGVYAQRERLPAAFHPIGRNRLERVVEQLFRDKRLLKCAGLRDKLQKWLDVPSGAFARGVGQFATGADEADE